VYQADEREVLWCLLQHRIHVGDLRAERFQSR
jgi:hypothetical protein